MHRFHLALPGNILYFTLRYSEFAIGYFFAFNQQHQRITALFMSLLQSLRTWTNTTTRTFSPGWFITLFQSFGKNGALCKRTTAKAGSSPPPHFLRERGRFHGMNRGEVTPRSKPKELRDLIPSDDTKGYWMWGHRSCGVPLNLLTHTFSLGEPYKNNL
jgi:hypothetical protein